MTAVLSEGADDRSTTGLLDDDEKMPIGAAYDGGRSQAPAFIAAPSRFCCSSGASACGVVSNTLASRWERQVGASRCPLTTIGHARFNRDAPTEEWLASLDDRVELILQRLDQGDKARDAVHEDLRGLFFLRLGVR